MLRNSVFVLALTFGFSQASVSMHNPFYCFDTDPVRPQNTMFATKVAYEAVRGNGVPIVSSNLFSNCCIMEFD